MTEQEIERLQERVARQQRLLESYHRRSMTWIEFIQKQQEHKVTLRVENQELKRRLRKSKIIVEKFRKRCVMGYIDNNDEYRELVELILKPLSLINQTQLLIKDIRRMRRDPAANSYNLFYRIIRGQIVLLQELLDSRLVILWDELGDIPIDEEECIEQDFYQFETGTHRETIWHWFDKHHSKGVAEGLMYAKGEE